MTTIKDKKRSSSIKDKPQYYQYKDLKNLVQNQKSNLQVSQSVSLQHVLKELARTSPKQQIVKNVKKTPSTSLHTPADFTKREQSCIKKESSPLTSYRSRQKNLWIDLINSKCAQQALQDQRAATEYRANLEVTGTLISDWKQPYYPFKQKTPQNEFLRPEPIEYNKWCDLLRKKIEKRIL
ncbi:hypothetical protein pb186bvf_018189 [Paramecium bursaria]